VHPADRYRLRDPVAASSADLVESLGLAGVTFTEPDDVRPLADATALEIAGLELTVDHTPGHTEGSVIFRTADGGPDGAPLMFSGDLLFAGSVGRSDLPGGDPDAMRASLARLGSADAPGRIAAPDETVVLPGHGRSTTLGRERSGNPYLREATAKPEGAARRGGLAS
jgi:hydroxyacylglutathione hydrolase